MPSVGAESSGVFPCNALSVSSDIFLAVLFGSCLNKALSAGALSDSLNYR